jgi:hypothetical protein
MFALNHSQREIKEQRSKRVNCHSRKMKDILSDTLKNAEGITES